jgi:UDPglucose 6-dehydrogenase
MSRPVIGYAGLTHLGLCSGIAAASKGFTVVGYHGDTNLIAAIESGKLPVVEPDLDGMFAANRGRLTFSAKPESLKGCDVVYLAVDVPTDDDGKSDLSPIEAMIETVTHHLNDEAILVILCQVPPGFTRGKCLGDEQLFYQVETLIFGRAVERATAPERFIIGCANPGEPLPQSYGTFLDSFDCPLLPMGYESAELAKIAINCFLVASVSTTNTLAGLCERLGADWSEIAPSLRLDARIGPKAYLNPGLGISGGNLERDLATVCCLGEVNDSDTRVIDSFRGLSAYAKDWIWRVVENSVLEGAENSRVAVLGLAYKENTHSTKNSPALVLLDHLKEHEVRVFDPVVSADVVPQAMGADSALAACEGAEVTVIATPWPEFGELDPKALATTMNGTTLIDPYAMLDGAAVTAAGLSHYTLGCPPTHPSSRSPGHPAQSAAAG